MAIAMNPQKPTAASFAEQAQKQFGDRATAALAVYPATNDTDVLQTAADLASDLFISYSTWKWIEVHAQTAAPVYRYRFDRVLPEANGSNRFGAAHAVDIEYAFNTLDSKPAAWQAGRPPDRPHPRHVLRELRQDRQPERHRGPRVARVRQDAPGDVRRLREQGRPRAGRARYEFIDSVSGK